MTLALLEGAIDAVAEYLQANMAAKVADLNVRYSDDMVAPVSWYLGALPLATPEQPSVCLLGGSWSPKAQRLGNVHVSNSINLIVFVGDDDVERRFRRLCRYALGLVELCCADKTLSGYNIILGSPVALTDAMATPPFLQGITVPILAEQMETF